MTERRRQLSGDAYAITLDAKNPQAYLRKCMRAIFVGELAQKMTCLGTKENKAAKNFIIDAAIRGAFERKFKNEAITPVEDVGKKFFHQAHDRITKKRKHDSYA